MFAERLAPDDETRLNEWLIVEQTGWTLDYIRSLDMDDRLAYVQIARGIAAARAHEQRRQNDAAASRRGRR